MRNKWSVTSDYELHSKLKELSYKTRIPVSKLLDEAIKDLLMKHNENLVVKAVYDDLNISETK